MSKLEQNTTALDEVLAMVNALPDAGGGGGGVETCTVTITQSGNSNISLCATIIENGQITTYGEYLVSGSTLTIEKVLCGSLVYLYSSLYSVPGFRLSNMDFVTYSNGNRCYDAVKAPTEANTVGTVTIYDDM